MIRSTADQTFLLRAAVDHAIYLDQPLFVTLYDYSQCFDSLWLNKGWSRERSSQHIENTK